MNRRGLVSVLADSVSVLLAALRLLARHWPALLVIFLAGVVVRELVMRAAVQVSLFNAELGLLVLLLAPMTSLTALVLMLRVVRPSLWLDTGPGEGPPAILAHLGSVLVPFMTIYYFEDDLFADLREYNSRLFDHYLEQALDNLVESVDAGTEYVEPATPIDRFPYDLSLALAAVVLGALLGRWLLGRWPAAQRHRWLGIPGAYLELVWLTAVLVLAFQAITDLIDDWGGNRRLGQALRGLWEQGAGNASGATSAPEEAAAWSLAQFGHVETVLIIPLTWLAIGAVVLGHQPPGLEGVGRGRAAYERARARWQAAPAPVLWVGSTLTGDLRERFTPLVHGVRMMVRAGVVPMLLFCLAFVAARATADWLWQLERLAIGPEDFQTVWSPLAWPLGELNRAVATALLVCLLAAAVDRALRAVAQTTPGAAPRDPQATTSPTSKRA